MDYVLTEWDHGLDDEPYLIYSELDGGRMETRKVEFFRNGICFSYGAERGSEGALSDVPFPEDLRKITGQTGECRAKVISRQLFQENRSRGGQKSAPALHDLYWKWVL